MATPSAAPPRSQTPPAGQQPSQQPSNGHAGTIAAVAAAATAAALIGVPTPSPPGVTLVRRATAKLVGAMQVLFRQRRAGLAASLTETAMQQMPSADPSRVAQLVKEEMEREVTYQRKALARLAADLPVALANPDPSARVAAVAQVLEREKRFLAQREQAAAQRMVSALEADVLKTESPLGAYWHLSPDIHNHCPLCLAMGEKFWPWQVLDAYKLPQHPNCGCRLLSLDEATSAGLMHSSQVPDGPDALVHAKLLMSEARKVQEALSPEELDRFVTDWHARVVQEVAWRDVLRYPKGTQQGGEFMPKGGTGALSSSLDTLRELAKGYSPEQAEKMGLGRHVMLRGESTFVPREHWEQQAAGHTYTSPAGATHIYRDGHLLSEHHPDLGGTMFGGHNDTLPLGHMPEPEEIPAEGWKLPDAPKDTIPDYTGTPLVLGKSAGGSNGAVWAFDPAGDRWLVKTYRGNVDRVATELLANAIYRDLGATAPAAGVLRVPDAPDFSEMPDVKIHEPALPKGKRVSTGIVVRHPNGHVTVYEPKGHFGGYEHSFPKGGLEHGLTGQQNAHKELFEETGLHAHIVGHIGDYQGTTGVTRYYLGTPAGGVAHPDDPTPYVNGESETAAVKTVAPGEALKLLNVERDQQVLHDALAMGSPEQRAGAAFPPEHLITALAYPALPGETRKITTPSRDLGEHFMADALLANWDFVGLTDDNVLWQPDGKPARLDQGGTFQYRAQGAPKPYGPVPSEVWSMMSAKGQGFDKVDVSKSEMRQQARQIGETLTDEHIDHLVDSAPFANTKMREEIRASLQARVQWMRDFAAGDEQVPAPLEGHKLTGQLAQTQRTLDASPEEMEALDRFLIDGKERRGVNDGLRSKSGKVADAHMDTLRGMDSLLRHTRIQQDMIVHRPIDPGMLGDLTKLPGKVLRDAGFTTAAVHRSDARSAPGRLELHVPAGAQALYTRGMEGISHDDPEHDVVLPRGTRVRIRGVRQQAGRTVIDGQVVG